MTDDPKLHHTWNNHLNRIVSVRARIKSIARALGRSAAERDYTKRLKTGEQPFGQTDDAI